MHCKKTIDARSYSHQMLEQMRKDAVKRVDAGESPEFVAAGLGINRRTIYRWLLAYHSGGVQALDARPIPGAPPKLGAEQAARLARMICDKTPQQYQFGYALWTLALIRELISRQFDVKLSEVSVSRLIKRIGFMPQRPLHRAWQQDRVFAQNWMDTDYPRIARRAKKEGARIFFADEAEIRPDSPAGTAWPAVERTPATKASGARCGFNMLSAANAMGHFHFMTVEASVTAELFLEFLKRLIADVERRIFLIVDGRPVHRAKLVQQFVADNIDRIELFRLPPYASEPNPDELVGNASGIQ